MTSKKLTFGVLAMGLAFVGACKKDDDVRRVDETRPGVATERVGNEVTGTGAPVTRPLTDEERARAANPGVNTGTGTTGTGTAGTGTTGAGPTGTGAQATGMTGSTGAVPGSAVGGAVDPNSPVYGNCMAIIEKMRTCAKEPGFKTYQARWTSKGAAPAGSKLFERRIENWREESGRRSECDNWSRREAAEQHLGMRSKLAESLKDTKLTCTLFAQELDDDGWVPAAMVEAPRETR